MTDKKPPQIIAVGGGKGGVGKSSISSGLAIAIAQAGHTTTIIDLDLGGANLHTLFGLKTTDRGIGDFIYNPKSRNLADYAIDTDVKGLKLISGNGFIPGIANLEHSRKLRVLRALRKLDSEFVILDLGAGTSYNVIDFFSMTQSGVVITLPEPTAILNAYEFLKNVVYRILTQRFKRGTPVFNIINDFKRSDSTPKSEMEGLIDEVAKTDLNAANEIKKICHEFRPALILNMCRGKSAGLGNSLGDICSNYLNVKLSYLGAVSYDDEVRESNVNMKPFLISSPDAECSRSLRVIAEHSIERNWLNPSIGEQFDALTDADIEKQEQEEQKEASANVSTILKGHSDVELSSLLGSFYHASKVQLKNRWQGEGGDLEHRKGVEVPAETTVQALKISQDIDIEPRLDSKLKVPHFVSMERIYPRRPGVLARWFLPFSNRRKLAAGVMSAVTQILKIVDSKNIDLTMASIEDRAPKTPETGSAWMEVGLQLIKTDRIAAAQLAFAHALACLPDNAAVSNNRAASLIATGMMEPALDVLTNGLLHHPDDRDLNYNIGLVHLAMLKYEMAADAFEKVNAGAKEKSLSALQLEAYCRYKAQQFDVAERLYAEIAELVPLNPDVRFNRALAQLHVGQYQGATETFTSVLAVLPEDAEALAGRGLAHWHEDKAEEAVTDLTRAIKIKPADLSIRTARGLLCFQRGQYDVAIGDIQIITELVPNNEQFQELLNQIHQRIGV